MAREISGLALGLVVLVGCSASSTASELGQEASGAGSPGAGATTFGGAGGAVSGGGGDTSFGGLLNVGGSPISLDGGCGSLSIDTSVEEVVTPGNVLIIFDQSDSMTAADFNGQVRWLAASDAVVAAITPIKDSLTIGAVFFPSVLGGSFLVCDINTVSAINDAASPNPQIPFMPGGQFLGAWGAHWARNPLTLGTPIDAGLQRGDEALASASLPGNTVVLFVTDGEPTCNIGTNTTDLPAKWLAAGIPTHVIGLPGAGAGVLQQIATAGGTQNYLLPSDGAQLAQELSSITSTIVKHSLNSCQITLSQKPPGDVLLIVTEAADGKEYGVQPGPDGWTLAADGSTATLNGQTCTDATGGRFSKISFAFACKNVPILR